MQDVEDKRMEENFGEWMQKEVEPYLQKRRKEGYLNSTYGSEEGLLFYVHYVGDQSSRALLISHGLTESAEKYRELAYKFLQRGYEVYVLEHCGHGRSYRLLQDRSLVHIDHYERYVQDLLSMAHFIRQEQPELSLELLGHSMGGGIAAAAAAVEPDLFHRVLLSSPMIRPSSGVTPWVVAKIAAYLVCWFGKATSYVCGHHPYDGKERFEDSASLSEPRFQYYQRIRNQNELFHGNAASFGWLKEAVRLNHFLQTEAPQRITTSVLLLQAGRDASVSNAEQNRFMRKLKERGVGELCIFPEAKHEIYNSEGNTLQHYERMIFS